MFYDKYIKLCEFKGVSPTKAAKDMGLSKATPTKWKKSGATPTGETLKKLADYFEVQEGFLLRDDWELSPFSEEEIELIRLYRKADKFDKVSIWRTLNHYKEDTSIRLEEAVI